MQIALAVAPDRVGWCWRQKRMGKHLTAVPVDFTHFHHAVRLAEFMAEQPAWAEPVNSATEQTPSQIYTILCGDLGEKRITEQEFGHGVQRLMMSCLYHMTPRRAAEHPPSSTEPVGINSIEPAIS
jgi:hypothetical protein